IPAAGVTLNASWTDTTSRTDRAGIFDRVTVTTIATSRAAAIEELAGAHALRLEVTAGLAITGAGNQGGQAMDLAGRGTRHAIEYVAVDGRFLGGQSLDSTDLEIAVLAQGQVVSIKQIAKSIVQVLPYAARRCSSPRSRCGAPLPAPRSPSPVGRPPTSNRPTSATP